MKQVLITYFSGAGATKRVAEILLAHLSQTCKVDLLSVENKELPCFDNYDALVIGTPTYHAAPAKSIMRYYHKIARLKRETPGFIYNTRGLWSFNTNRILANKIREKNIITVMDGVYRSPASDGSIIAPSIKRFFEFEKGIESKISNDCKKFLTIINQNAWQGYIPRFRLGSILNAPNKAAGQLITLKIYAHENKCIKCGRCIEECPNTAFSKKEDGNPLFIPKNCEKCYRCIHHCPKAALSLSKRKAPRKLLEYEN